MQIIIHKYEGEILNLESFFKKVLALEDNCLHRVTLENINNPVVVAEYDPELQVTIVSK